MSCVATMLAEWVRGRPRSARPRAERGRPPPRILRAELRPIARSRDAQAAGPRLYSGDPRAKCAKEEAAAMPEIQLNRRLTPQDAMFLYTDKPNQPMHGAGVAVYVGELSRAEVI